MEKVKQSEKKASRLAESLRTKQAKWIVGTCFMSGIGIALPRIFHLLAGSTAGATFLPMHFMVLIAALTFGMTSASIVAGSSVIVSYLLTGMPSLARLPYMAIEIVIYAVLLSILHKKYNSYVSLIATIILGRILYAGVLFVAIHGLGLQTYGLSVMQSMQAGLPGILLQFICVPIIAKAIKKGIRLDD